MEQEQFLTFNPRLANAFNISLLEPSEDLSNMNLPLPEEWTLWVQLYSREARTYADMLKPVITFGTVQSFWQVWSHVPQPSELLERKHMIFQSEEGAALQADALMLFRKGIEPAWEDISNKDGLQWDFRVAKSQPGFRPERMDEWWNNLVLAMVGGTLDQTRSVCGVKLVDKLLTNKEMVRFEVWASNERTETLQMIDSNLHQVFTYKLGGGVGTALQGDRRSHTNPGRIY